MKNRHALFLLLFALFTLAVFAANVASAGMVPVRTPARSAPSLPPAPYVTFLPFVAKPGDAASANALWRFGAGKAQPTAIGNYYPTADGLRLGWYTDFLATANSPEPYGIEYVYTVRVKQWKLVPGTSAWTNGGCVGCAYVQPYTYTVSPSLSAIRDMAAAKRGKTWLLGNEIERIDWNTGSQDEILPEEYARAYHDIYSAIKSADPTALVAIGGMIQATPLRLKYLQRVWDGYFSAYSQTMPVDIWNVHAFVVQEKRNDYGAEIPAGLTENTGMLYSVPEHKNFDIAWSNIVDLRTWMKNHGQQNKPLYISEYGVLYPDQVSPGDFTPEQVKNSFMYPSFDYFLNHPNANLGYPADGYRLVQRWSWYSLDDDSTDINGFPSFNGNLFYSGLAIPLGSGKPQGITTLGTHWRSYVQGLGIASGKPYTPQSSVPPPTIVQSNNSTQTAQPDLTNCPENNRVRLLYYERPPGGCFTFNSKGSSPRLQEEKTICVP